MDDRGVEELQRIWELKEKGALSEQEYLRLKAELLTRGAAAAEATQADRAPVKLTQVNGEASAPGSKMNKPAIGCIAIIVLLFVLIGIGGTQADKNGKSATDKVSGTAAAASEQASKPADYKAMLKREIASMRKEPRPATIEPTKEAIMAETLLIGVRAKAYEEQAPATLDRETKALRAEYKHLATAYQVASFPKLRAAQAKLFDQLMWEQNIRVAAVGPANKILRFTGGLFANNAAIAAARDNVAETLTLLRFDQDRYEWYRGSEYTYYKRSSLPDAAFANFDGTNWVKVEEPSASLGAQVGEPPSKG
jgi:hypothetical protein